MPRGGSSRTFHSWRSIENAKQGTTTLSGLFGALKESRKLRKRKSQEKKKRKLKREKKEELKKEKLKRKKK